MFSVETTCFPTPPETDGGSGEMKCLSTLAIAGSSLADSVATEMVNDVFERAFNIIMSNSVGSQSPRLEISKSVVGDILQNILSPGLDASQKVYRDDETALLDDEIKRIIKEMKFPIEQKKSPICTIGVGDQLEHKSEGAPDQVLAESPKRNTLERKNRFTNLVRNSKLILNKFVTSPNEPRQPLRSSKSEDTHERLLRNIDYEARIKKRESMHQGCSHTSPGIMEFPSDTLMEIIDLDTSNYKSSDTEVTETRRSKSLDRKNLGKKKWNFGRRILRYFMRRHKTSDRVANFEPTDAM